MIEYIKLFWEGAPEGEPSVILYEAVSYTHLIPAGEPLAPVLERFRKATQREPLYQCIFHEDDGSMTESYGLMFE